MVYPNFRKRFSGNVRPFDFHSGISSIFGSMICFSETSSISRVSGTFLRKYLNHLSPFLKFLVVFFFSVKKVKS